MTAADEHELHLGADGHYFTPNATGGGFCQAAIVTDVLPEVAPITWRTVPKVNVAGWQHDGELFKHLDVPVYLQRTDGLGVGAASFHRRADCPWGR